MGPYELIIFACLAVNLGCRDFNDHEIRFQSALECTTSSMGHLALWHMKHPARVIKRWRCAPVGEVRAWL